MKKKYLPILIFISMQIAFAQETRILTLDECVQIGLEGNRSLKSQRYEVQAADALFKEMKTGLLPTLSFRGSYARLSEVPPFSVQMPPPISSEITVSEALQNAYSLRLSLKQPVFTGFRLSSTAQMYESYAEASHYDLDVSQQNLREQITEVYWLIYKTGQTEKALMENLILMEAHKKDIDNFFAQGLVTKDEVLMVESKKAGLNIKLLEIRNNIEVLELGLKNLIGIPLQANIEFRFDEGKVTDFPVDLNTDLQSTLEKRGEIKSVEQRIKAADSAVKAATGGFYPQVFLAGNFYYDRPNSRYMPTADEFNDSWDVGVGISFDLWNWGKTGYQYQQAKFKHKSILEKEKQIKDGIVVEVTQKYLKLKQVRESITAAEIAVQAAEESRRITNDRFLHGSAKNSELLEAESNLLNAKTEYANLIADYHIAKIKYEIAVMLK